MVCCHHFKIVNNLWTRAPSFYFEQGPENYVAVLFKVWPPHWTVSSLRAGMDHVLDWCPQIQSRTLSKWPLTSLIFIHIKHVRAIILYFKVLELNPSLRKPMICEPPGTTLTPSIKHPWLFLWCLKRHNYCIIPFILSHFLLLHCQSLQER
jgi:hypothetical protein